MDADGHIQPADLDDRSQSQHRLYQENGPSATPPRIKKKWVIFPVYRSIYLSLKARRILDLESLSIVLHPSARAKPSKHTQNVSPRQAKRPKNHQRSPMAHTRNGDLLRMNPGAI